MRRQPQVCIDDDNQTDCHRSLLSFYTALFLLTCDVPCQAWCAPSFESGLTSLLKLWPGISNFTSRGSADHQQADVFVGSFLPYHVQLKLLRICSVLCYLLRHVMPQLAAVMQLFETQCLCNIVDRNPAGVC